MAHETDEDVRELSRLLDESYALAGPHLLSIHTPNWRMSAQEIVNALTGMVVLSLATVNSRGEPIQGPVDGLFYKGRFYFGSAPESMRARHITANPAVSVAHVRGEELAIVVHGKALEVDKGAQASQGYRRYLEKIYGKAMTKEHWEGSVVYWELEPRKMFALAPEVGGA